MNEYIKQQNEKQKTENLAALEKVRQENIASYETAQAASNTAFQDAMTEMFRDSQRRQADTNAVLRANALNEGAGSQAALSQGNAAMGNEYRVKLAKKTADREIELAKKNNEEKAKAAVQQAIANQDYNTANQLYAEYQDERKTAQEQVDRLISAGVMPDAELIGKSGYTSDYVSAKYAKSTYRGSGRGSGSGSGSKLTAEQVGAIADAATSKLKAATDKISGKSAKRFTEIPAATNMKNDAASIAQASAAKQGAAKQTTQQQASKAANQIVNNGLLTQKLNTLTDAKSRTQYVDAMYSMGAIDKPTYLNMSMVATMMPFGKQPTLTTAQLAKLPKDEPLDTATAQKIVQRISGGTPLKLPTTAREATEMVYDYAVKEWRKEYDKALEQYVENAQYMSGNDTADEMYNSLQEISKLIGQSGNPTDTNYDAIAKQVETRLKAYANLYNLPYKTAADYPEYDEAVAREMAIADNYSTVEEFFQEKYADEIPTGWERAGNAAKSVWQETLGVLNTLAAAIINTPSGDFGGVRANPENSYVWDVAAEPYKEKAAELFLMSEESLAEAKKYASSTASFLVDLEKVALEVLEDAAVSAVTSGYGGLANMALRTYGSTYYTSVANGMDEGDAALLALERSAMGVLTERLGGLKFYGGGKLLSKIESKILPDAMAKLEKNYLFRTVVKGGMEESLEELIENVGNNYADVLMGFRDDASMTDEEASELLYEMLIASIIGFAGANVELGVDKVKDSKNKPDPAMIADTAADVAIGNMAQNGKFSEQTAEVLQENVEQRAEQRLDAAIDNTVRMTAQNAPQADVVATQQTTPQDVENGTGEVKTAEYENMGVSTKSNAEMFADENAVKSFSGESTTPTDYPFVSVSVNMDGNPVYVFHNTEADAVRTADNANGILGENTHKVVNLQAGENVAEALAVARAARQSVYNSAVAYQGGAEEVARTRQELADFEAAQEASMAEQPLTPNPDGLGGANAGFTDRPMTQGEQWVAEAQNKGDSAVHPISNEQMSEAIARGEMPQDVPKVDLNGHLTSKTVSTVANSGVTTQEMAEAIVEDAAQGKFSRIPYTDQAAISKAEAEIEDVGWEQAIANYEAKVAQGIGGKDMAVMGIVLYNNAVTKGDYATAMDILALMVKVSTSNAQGVQAMRILNKLSPDSRLYMAFKSAEAITREIKAKYNLEDDIELDPDLVSAYRDALMNGEKTAIREAWGNIEQNIADQIPPDWRDKLNAWRYLSMLGNPRTHVRNIVGNLGFMPVRAVKDVIATGIEAAVDKVSGGKIDEQSETSGLNSIAKKYGISNQRARTIYEYKKAHSKVETREFLTKKGYNAEAINEMMRLFKFKVERTKAFLNPASVADRALIVTAWADYANASEAIMSGGKYNDLPNTIDDRRQIFKFKPLEGARKLNTNALNVEDRWFSQPAYAAALAGYLKANGISAQDYADGNISDEAAAKAQAYAIKEAQKATYRDTNVLSKAVNKFRVKPAEKDASTSEKVLKGVSGALVEGVLPFKKTPANILARALEYSPLGLTAYMTVGTAQVAKGKMTAAEFIDGLASGLTGTGILALGMALRAMGLLSGKDDDDELKKLQGEQSYALQINGKSYTLDWLAPEALPLFVGVELYNNVFEKDETASVWDLIDSLGNITEPMFEMSMLQGVNDLIDTVGYADKPLWAVMVNAATGYISQFIPTIGGQIERAFTEDTRQSTFIDKDSETPSSVQYWLGKTLNKVPGVEYQQIEYVDAWGRTQETGDMYQRIANNFFNPAYVNDIRVEAAESELNRLAELGYSVMPQKPSQSVQINGKYLTAEQYQTYAKEVGQTSLNTVNALIESSAYKYMSDADKASAIADCYAYAKATASAKIDSGVEIPKWVSDAKASGNIVEAIAYRTINSNADNYKDAISAAVKSGLSEKTILDNIGTDKGIGKAYAEYKDSTPNHVSLEQYSDAYYYKNNEAKGTDKNNDGKTDRGSVKADVENYLKRQGYTSSQVAALMKSLYS